MTSPYTANMQLEEAFQPAESDQFRAFHLDEVREAEARALNSLADRMEKASRAGKSFFGSSVNPELEEALRDNSKLWGLFYNKAIETKADPKPVLAENILKLSNFVFKKCYLALGQQKSTDISVLIQINRDIAKGLLYQT